MKSLKIYTIYDRPVDYPDQFVVRLHVNEGPTAFITLHDTLDAARAAIPPGLYCLPRQPGDVRSIVESWL